MRQKQMRKIVQVIAFVSLIMMVSILWPAPGSFAHTLASVGTKRDLGAEPENRFPLAPWQFQFPSCSYNSAMPGAGYQIIPQPAPVTRRQQGLFDWFSPWAIARNPMLQYMRFPVLVLVGEKNARAGSFGIAINPQWFAELDEDVTIGIYAHELGHVSQAYGLIPMDQLAARYGAEGQADYFAGTLLKASRQFSPSQMQKFTDWVTPSPGDQAHAPGRVRADLMRAGYNNTP